MKNFIKYLAVLLLVFGYTSCDELDELTEVDFDATVTDVINVNAINAGVDVPLNNSINVGLADAGGQVQDYLNQIERVTFNSLTYQVINFVGDPAGVMTVDIVADGVVMDSHDGVVVSGVAGTIFTIDDTATLNAIASDLKNGNRVTFGIVGTATSEGMDFDIQVTLDVEVTADAL